jgi:hypothetical protein
MKKLAVGLAPAYVGAIVLAAGTFLARVRRRPPGARAVGAAAVAVVTSFAWPLLWTYQLYVRPHINVEVSMAFATWWTLMALAGAQALSAFRARGWTRWFRLHGSYAIGAATPFALWMTLGAMLINDSPSLPGRICALDVAVALLALTMLLTVKPRTVTGMNCGLRHDARRGTDDGDSDCRVRRNASGESTVSLKRQTPPLGSTAERPTCVRQPEEP